MGVGWEETRKKWGQYFLPSGGDLVREVPGSTIWCPERF